MSERMDFDAVDLLRAYTPPRVVRPAADAWADLTRRIDDLERRSGAHRYRALVEAERLLAVRDAELLMAMDAALAPPEITRSGLYGALAAMERRAAAAKALREARP